VVVEKPGVVHSRNGTERGLGGRIKLEEGSQLSVKPVTVRTMSTVSREFFDVIFVYGTRRMGNATRVTIGG